MGNWYNKPSVLMTDPTIVDPFMVPDDTSPMSDIPMPDSDILEELRQLDAATADFFEASLKPSTRVIYAARWRQFAAFCERFKLQALSCTPQTLARFLTHEARMKRKFSYIHREIRQAL